MKRRLAGAAVLLALGLAGCASGPTDDGVATAGGPDAKPSASGAGDQLSDDEKARRFARCMRDHGVDMPDPGSGADGGGVRFRFGDKGDHDKVEAAMQACRELAPNGGEPPTLSPEQIEQSRNFSRCMRENGVPNFPDPDANGLIKMGPEAKIDFDDPKVKAANDKCEKLRPRPAGPMTQVGPK